MSFEGEALAMGSGLRSVPAGLVLYSSHYRSDPQLRGGLSVKLDNSIQASRGTLVELCSIW